MIMYWLITWRKKMYKVWWCNWIGKN